jgi:6-phosphogluconolactonase (cycloisomerase 2 family)
MKLSKIGRISMALVASVAMGLGMTACGGGTIGYMWVIGTQYNQIAGFKIDQLTGNLTATPHSPFSSGGTNPAMIAVRPGGRYVYVINKATGTNGNISVFSVGGDGVLTFQETYNSQGNTPVYVQVDSTGNFLYVLDQQAPDIITKDQAGNTVTTHQTVGDVTVFAIDGNTGRLTLVTNQQSLTNGGGTTQLTYFPVGSNPSMIKVSGGGCLFALDSGDNTIFPYSVNSGTGQLTRPTSTTIVTGAGRLTSININGSNVYLTDAGLNQILPYTVGTGCALNTANGGAVPNLSLTANPVNSIVDTKGKYFYVINQSTTNSQNTNSTISAFTIDATTGKLQPLGDAANPYSIGSGPGCIVEDPSSQYIYTANFDGTVTGKKIDQNTGKLSNLDRGSTFPATGQSICLVVSGNIS